MKGTTLLRAVALSSLLLAVAVWKLNLDGKDAVNVRVASVPAPVTNAPPPAPSRKITNAFGWRLGQGTPWNQELRQGESGLSFSVFVTNFPPFDRVDVAVLDDGRVYMLMADAMEVGIDKKELLLSTLASKYGEPKLHFWGDKDKTADYTFSDGYAEVDLSYNFDYEGLTIYYIDNELQKTHTAEQDARNSVKISNMATNL